MNISGGSFEDYMEVRAGSIANISGGTFAFRFYVLGGTANISGGTFGTDVEVKTYSTGAGVGVINITGGTFTGSAAASAGSGQINILGGLVNNTGPLEIGGETSIVGGTIGTVRANSSYLTVAGGQIQQF